MWCNFLSGLNSIHINVWGVLLILCGVGLVLKGHGNEGGTIMTGGFALLRDTKQNGASGGSSGTT